MTHSCYGRVVGPPGGRSATRRYTRRTAQPWAGISDATGGAAYKTAAGYLEPYGDYGELAITSAGKSFAVWGEGTSYDGPGGVWYNREP